jgi:hypothetical protein
MATPQEKLASSLGSQTSNSKPLCRALDDGDLVNLDRADTLMDTGAKSAPSGD